MEPHKCPVCDGFGWSSVGPQDGSTNTGKREPCHACNGRGILWEPYDSNSVPVYSPCYEVHAS